MGVRQEVDSEMGRRFGFSSSIRWVWHGFALESELHERGITALSAALFDQAFTDAGCSVSTSERSLAEALSEVREVAGAVSGFDDFEAEMLARASDGWRAFVQGVECDGIADERKWYFARNVEDRVEIVYLLLDD